MTGRRPHRARATLTCAYTLAGAVTLLGIQQAVLAAGGALGLLAADPG